MKKRESVSPVTSSPARMSRVSQVPTMGTARGKSVPTLVAARESSSQGRRYPVNPKARETPRSRMPVSQVASRGLR